MDKKIERSSNYCGTCCFKFNFCIKVAEAGDAVVVEGFEAGGWKR